MIKEKISNIEINKHAKAYQLITQESDDLYITMSRLHRYLREFAVSRGSLSRHCGETLRKSAYLFSQARRNDAAFSLAFVKVMSIDEALTKQDVELVLSTTVSIHEQVVEHVKLLTGS